MISIAIDEPDDDRWRETVTEEKMTWRHLNDRLSAPGEEFRLRYAIMGVPACFLIDPEGRIALKGHPMEILSEVERIVLPGRKKIDCFGNGLCNRGFSHHQKLQNMLQKI